MLTEKRERPPKRLRKRKANGREGERDAQIGKVDKSRGKALSCAETFGVHGVPTIVFYRLKGVVEYILYQSSGTKPDGSR